MSRISPEEVRKIAQLARLDLSAEEVETFAGQFARILDYVDKLAEVDIEGVEPFLNAASADNVFRADAAGASLPREEGLANAPSQAGGFFKVPRVT